jgi:hypothetical protein
MRLDIPALIVPGRDAAHATSAARYLEECLPRADYWHVPVEQQTENNVPKRVIEFLQNFLPREAGEGHHAKHGGGGARRSASP